jgi:hypothetical protein
MVRLISLGIVFSKPDHLGKPDAWEERDFFAMARVRLGLGKTTLGAPMVIRYAHASTDDYDLAFHTVEPRSAGCEQTFLRDTFGKRPVRVGCAQTLSQLRPWASGMPPRT